MERNILQLCSAELSLFLINIAAVIRISETGGAGDPRIWPVIWKIVTRLESFEPDKQVCAVMVLVEPTV